MVKEVSRNRPEAWLAAVSMLILRIGIVAVLGYVLYRVGFIIVVVLISVMLAFSMAPAVDWLQRSGMFRPVPVHFRRGLATAIVFLLLGVALVSLGVLIVKPLATELSTFAANWTEHQARASEWIRAAQEWYLTLPADIRTWVEAQQLNDLGARATEQLQRLGHRTVESGMLLVELILIPVLAFSFLTESRPLKREFAMILPRSQLRDGLFLLRRTGQILQSYAMGQLILALIAGVVVWLLLTGLGIRYALVLALVAAVTRVIPVIGPLIGGIPIVLISTLQGSERGLIVLIAFTLLHLLESKVVMPRLIGYRIKLHPAVVIIVLLIGAEFFGMWGMFLAAPFAAVVKVLFHHFLVRPRLHTLRAHHPSSPPAPNGGAGAAAPPGFAPEPQKETELERPAVAGVRRHTGAH